MPLPVENEPKNDRAPSLLFREAVLFSVFPGGHAVFFFKGPKKAGVILKSILMIYMAYGLI